MFRLKQSQWDVFACELEHLMIGATVHDIAHKQCTIQAQIMMWIHFMNGRNEYASHEQNCLEIRDKAIEQLKKFGYDDYRLFIEEVEVQNDDKINH